MLVAVWWIFHRGQPEPAATLGPPDTGAAPPASDERAPAPRPATPPAAAAATIARAMPAPDEGAPDAGKPDVGDELPPTHPITPTHARLQRENDLLGAMNGALDVNDGAGLRHLLDQYRQEYPDDPNQLQEGYGIIADCLEQPGAAATAAGRRYFDRERGSILRRFVARHCQLQLP